MYADTHCHLFAHDVGVDDLLTRARADHVSLMVNVGVDLASSAECVAGADPDGGVWAAVGIHPHNAIESTEGVLERLAALARHPDVVGIGETGLDYFREHSPPLRQQESFREHVRLAKDLGKALIVHNRDATDDVLDILADEGAPDRVVFHCFSGGPDLAKVCVDAGYFMSFAGNLTFRNAAPLRDVAATVPLDLLVTETDSPYLSPHPHRGKPNEPGRVGFVVEMLAGLHELEVDEMARLTRENACRLFALPQPPRPWGEAS